MTIALDVKSLIIGGLSALILALIIYIAFLHKGIQSAQAVIQRQDKLIGIYDTYLDDSHKMLSITLASITEWKPAGKLND